MTADSDAEKEKVYKYHILNNVARVLMPWAYDNSDKFSEGARKILQANAREQAKKVMREIAPWIKPWRESGFNFDKVEGDN